MSSFLLSNRDPESHQFNAGDVIFAEGASADGFMYALLSGSVEIFRHERLLETVPMGGVFGELALIDNLPRSAAAIAKTDCRVAKISSEQFRELLLRNPMFAIEIMRLLAQRTRANLGT